MPFKLNCGYNLWILYKDIINPCFKPKSADELLAKVRELIIICKKNIYHTQKLQKRAYNINVKPKNNVSSNKIWLNSKYIKTKQNKKLKVKVFRLFEVLHQVGKQAYKLKFIRKWRMYDIFSILLLKQNTTRKR